MEKTLAQVAAYENAIKKTHKLMTVVQLSVFISMVVLAAVELYYV